MQFERILFEFNPVRKIKNCHVLDCFVGVLANNLGLKRAHTHAYFTSFLAVAAAVD